MPLLPRLSGRFLLAGAALAISAVTASAGSNAGASFYPNDPFFKPSGSLSGQWHLQNLYPVSAQNAGLDVKIVGAWAAGITGKGVVIGVMDDGVEGTHEDLAPNYIEALSKDFSTDNITPQFPADTDYHGTSVAGVAAGRGGNGIGITGAAPFASIVGLRVIGANTPTSAINDAFLYGSGASAGGVYLSDADIQVKTNSWGYKNPFDTELAVTIPGMKAALLNNTIILFSASNERGNGFATQQTASQLNKSNDLSIIVGAMGMDGKFASYSNYGSGLFVTAPSNGGLFGITTTDRTGANGYNSVLASTDGDPMTDLNYTATFGGTSSATPLVAGIMALAKQMTPAMDLRMAKHALATTSIVIDSTDNNSVSGGHWVTNGAGLNFNNDYGFGLIDATAFVNRVLQTAYVTDRTTVANSVLGINKVLTSSPYSKTITFGSSASIQHVETVDVAVSIAGTNFYKDLSLSITSPSGTTSELYGFDSAQGVDAGTAAAFNANTNGVLNWSFTSNAFWGENAVGDWTVSAATRAGTAMTWNSVTVTLNMGEVVLESGAVSLATNVKALSLNLDFATSALIIPVGKSFTVTDSVNLNGGIVTVAGTLDEASPNSAPAWNKLSRITITSGATLDALAGSTVKASRGIDVAGGLFRLASGVTLNAGTGISVRAGGVFLAANDLTMPGTFDVAGATASIGRDASTGAVTLAGAGSALVVGRDLISSGSINVTGGNLSVGRNITTTKLTLDGGSFSPGGLGVIGTTALTGALDVSGRSMLYFDAVGPASHDKVVVSAPAVLTGGTAVVNIISGGVIHVGDTFDVITGAVTGAFSSVVTTGDHPFIALDQVLGNAGTLTAAADFAAAATRIGGSPNQREVGAALGRVVTAGGPNAATFLTVAETVTGAAEAGALLSAFVPQNGLEVASSAYRTSTAVAGTYANFASRLHSGDIDSSGLWANPLFDSYSFDFVKPVSVVASNDYLPGAFEDDRSVSIWVNGNAGYTKTNASASQNRVKSKDTSFGAVVGADFRLTPAYEDDIHAGFFVGFQSADSKQGDSGSESETETTAFAPGVYVSGLTSGFELDAMFAYSVATYDLTRDIPAIGATPASKADASPGGNQAIARFGVARPFTFRKSTFSFTPTASLTYVTGEVDSYTENNGGIAGLSVEKQSYDSLQSNLGVRFQQQFDLSSVTLLPTVSVGWGHELIGQERDVGVTSSSLGAPFAYNARTPFIGRDFMTLSTGVTFYVSDNTRLNLGYDGEFFRENVPVSHRASATFTVKF